MLKRPFEYITDFYKERIERDRKNTEFIHSQTDGLITWIIGFAFTGLMILIANLKSQNLEFKQPTKPVVICLLITIILGIAFRYISFLVISFEKGLEDYYIGVFSKVDMTPTEVDEDVANADFESIIIHLKDDFGETITFQRELSNAEKAIEVTKLSEHYKKRCEVSKKELEISMNHIADVEWTSHRIPKQKNLELFDKAVNGENKIGYHAYRWNLARTILFTLSLLAFIAAVVIVCISLLLM